ncbi:MAG: flagellar hook-associated protein FlgK [Rhodospirillales bacterium]|nr:MAG: flagellar hook-associated protein FlgK [Rhodospirillales bacterium]
MSGDLTLALRTAQSGLLTNQLALNAVANNVSNVNTEGYSRKIVNLEHRVLAGTGAGVQLSELTRRVDEHLMRNVRAETSGLRAIDVQQPFHDRIQFLFGTPADNASLSHNLTRLSEAFETLATTPEGGLEQRELVRQADAVARQLRDMTASVQDLRLEADLRIGEAVAEINSLIDTIANLNDKVVRGAATRQGTADLEDQRDLALDRLAELIDTRVFKRGDGDVVVFTTGGQVLVDNVSTTLTHFTAANIDATATHAGGGFSGIFAGAAEPANDITASIRQGELKGLIELRDSILPNLQSTLDTLAADLRDTVNAVHNRGLAFPGLQDMQGTRIFTEPDEHRITIDGTVNVVLLDANGNQHAATTLPSGSQTIEAVRATLETFLQANGGAGSEVAFDADGRMTVSVGDPGLFLAFRDEAADGSLQDATITYEIARNATDFDIAGTVQGFSNFFGLNDFFVDNLIDNVHESRVLSPSFQAAAGQTLTVRNAGGAAPETISITVGDSLQSIAEKINAADAGVTATLIPDGSGVRLRLLSDDSLSFTITSGGELLSQIGMQPADVRVAGALSVRSDIRAQPSLVSRGALQFDPAKGVAGEYFASIGDDAVARNLAAAVGGAQSFGRAGSLGAATVSFSQYAATIIADASSQADTNRSAAEVRGSLVDSLKAKSDTVRGVNLDEEMSDLILFEHAYAAAARLISVVQSMFDALDRAVS